MTLTPKSKRELKKERRGGESPQDLLHKEIEPLLTQLHERMLDGITYKHWEDGKQQRRMYMDPAKIDMSGLPEKFLVSLVLRAIGELEDHAAFQKLAKEVEKPLIRKASGDSVATTEKALEKARQLYVRGSA